MSFTHTVGITYRTAAGTITSTTDSYTSDSEINEDVQVPATTTDKEIDVSFDPTKVKSMVLYSDKTVSLKTNAVGTDAVDSIALTAQKQVVWNSDSGSDIPFGGAGHNTPITKFYVTNGGLVAANLKFYCLLDLTP